MFLIDYHLDPPAVYNPPGIIAPAVVPQNAPVPPVDPAVSYRKRPARIPGLAGTNAAYLVPDNIRKKFVEGWGSHVPLPLLTDKGCSLKNKSSVSSSQEVLTYDSGTGLFIATPKSLSEHGELDLTFDEWHQAWRRLLDLIKTYIPQDFLVWETHYLFILNSENRAEMWPLYLAYDTEIRKRTTQSPIDPAVFSIGIWNDLETKYTAKKVLSIVQADLKQRGDRATSSQTTNPPPYVPRNPSSGSSFRNQLPSSDNPKTGRCIFCGDRSKTHLSRNCLSSCCTDGSPCHLSRQEPSGARISRSGQRYCYSWNGPSGCDQVPCKRGDHLCTLCGSSSHNAQQCNIIA